MFELNKELVKTSLIEENSPRNQIIYEIYFNNLSRVPIFKGTSNSKYYFIAKDLLYIKNNIKNNNFKLKEKDLHPFTVNLLNSDIKHLFSYKSLDIEDITKIEGVINKYNHYVEAIMIAKMIEREERLILITTFFAIVVPAATLLLSIVALVLTLTKSIDQNN